MNREEALAFLEEYQKARGWTPTRTFKPDIIPVSTRLYHNHLQHLPVSELARGWTDEPLIAFAMELRHPRVPPPMSPWERDYKERRDIFLTWDRLWKSFVMKHLEAETTCLQIEKCHCLEASMNIYVVTAASGVTFFLCHRLPHERWDKLLTMFQTPGLFELVLLQASGDDKRYILSAQKK